MNFIRLALALLVMESHAFPICYGMLDGEVMKRWSHGHETLGSLSVNLFFLMSGMLITASWLRSRSMSEFLLRRVRRIYPGFVVALSFTGILIWVLCPGFRAHAGHGVDWARTLVVDAVTLNSQSTMWPGTFLGNPMPGVANGSLWTIQKEFVCYLLVAVVGLFCLYKHRLLLLAAGCVTCAVYLWQLVHTFPVWGLHKSNPGELLTSRFYAYFAAGMLVWLFRDKIVFSRRVALIAGIVVIACLPFGHIFSALFLPLGGYAVLCLGFTRPNRLTRWTLNTDLSYGVYLYGYPVQQVAAMYSHLHNAWLNLLISVPVTLILAALSWHVVERRFLRMKSTQLMDYDPGQVAFATAQISTAIQFGTTLDTLKDLAGSTDDKHAEINASA